MTPEVAITTLVAAVAACLAIWLVLSWAAWSLALRANHPSPNRHRLLRRVTLPAGRRLAELTLAASAIALPACSPGAATPELSYVGPAPTTITTSPTTASPTTAPPTTVPSTTAPPIEAPSSEPEPGPATHTVAPGDSFWAIASLHAGQQPVAQYWRQLIEDNLDVIRSGNPDLIFAGEVLTLPQQ